MTVQRALPPSTARVLSTAASVALVVAATGIVVANVIGVYARLLWWALLVGWNAIG